MTGACLGLSVLDQLCLPKGSFIAPEKGARISRTAVAAIRTLLAAMLRACFMPKSLTACCSVEERHQTSESSFVSVAAVGIHFVSSPLPMLKESTIAVQKEYQRTEL